MSADSQRDRREAGGWVPGGGFGGSERAFGGHTYRAFSRYFEALSRVRPSRS